MDATIIFNKKAKSNYLTSLFYDLFFLLLLLGTGLSSLTRSAFKEISGCFVCRV